MNARDKELAKQAGYSEDFLVIGFPNNMEKFVALIRADERDRMCQRFNLSKEFSHEKAKGNETN